MFKASQWVQDFDGRGVILTTALGLFCCVLCGCAAPSVQAQKQSLKRDALGHRPGPMGFKTVIIDAGHGGHDSGAQGRAKGAVEKKLALDTAERLKKKLDGKFKVILLRGNDKFVDLDDRVAFANRYESAILVSLHYNSGPSSLRGPETYYWRVDSYSLARRIQWEMEKVSPKEHGNRGLVRRRLRLTRNPVIPSVLVELGYLSNASEVQLCVQSSYRDKMASAVARAIVAQNAKGDQGTGKLPPPINKPLSRASDPPGS